MMISRLLAAAVALVFCQSGRSEIIVGLDPSAPSNLLDLPGGGLSLVVNAPANNDAGLTMNVTFTPSANDLAVVGSAINLVEIGGNANGTGIYLLEGELYFLGKMQGVATNIIASGDFNDLDYSSGNNMVGIRSSFGPLTAGVEYSVGVIYDPLGVEPTVTIGVLPGGGTLVTESYNFTGRGVKNNWSGNDTITAFLAPANAGGSTNVTGEPFREGFGMTNLDGTASGAFLWNAQGVFDAPVAVEPVITSIKHVGENLWELEMTGTANRNYLFRSSPVLNFEPGELIENLSQENPGDAGTIGGPSNSVVTTDQDGRALVRMSLGNGPANFVRVVEAP